MLRLYISLIRAGKPLLKALLKRRISKGKEDPERIAERRGIASKTRPAGKKLLWIHAASVGETRSALILIEKALALYPSLHILMTSGTVTSARMMEKQLPEQAVHQFYPLDHPDWVGRFLDHWHPDAALWIESEVWPNMLIALEERQTPLALVNARLSDRSYTRWRMLRKTAARLFRIFDLVLTQTPKDAERFLTLGAPAVKNSGNVKYSAQPLEVSEKDLTRLSAHIGNRPLWVFASTHAGEEDIACRAHQILQNTFPDLLTIIVPRHIERREKIYALCEAHNLSARLRGRNKQPPGEDTDIYIADTMGELGLFYRLAPIACIGRSFSDDGGGGHNPLEAAQLNCAVLHGPHVQFQQHIYDDMNKAGAALKIQDETVLIDTLRRLLSDPAFLTAQQEKARIFVKNKAKIIDKVMGALKPFFNTAGFETDQKRGAA